VSEEKLLAIKWEVVFNDKNLTQDEVLGLLDAFIDCIRKGGI